MAKAISKEGGLGIIHRNQHQMNNVERLKKTLKMDLKLVLLLEQVKKKS